MASPKESEGRSVPPQGESSDWLEGERQHVFRLVRSVIDRNVQDLDYNIPSDRLYRGACRALRENGWKADYSLPMIRSEEVSMKELGVTIVDVFFQVERVIEERGIQSYSIPDFCHDVGRAEWWAERSERKDVGVGIPSAYPLSTTEYKVGVRPEGKTRIEVVGPTVPMNVETFGGDSREFKPGEREEIYLLADEVIGDELRKSGLAAASGEEYRAICEILEKRNWRSENVVFDLRRHEKFSRLTPVFMAVRAVMKGVARLREERKFPEYSYKEFCEDTWRLS